jgi:hypothetical protein
MLPTAAVRPRPRPCNGPFRTHRSQSDSNALSGLPTGLCAGDDPPTNQKETNMSQSFDYLTTIANDQSQPVYMRVKAIEALLGNGDTSASDAIRDAALARPKRLARPIIRCRFPSRFPSRDTGF